MRARRRVVTLCEDVPAVARDCRKGRTGENGEARRNDVRMDVRFI